MIYLQVIAGFLLLLGGAEALVRGSAAIARRFGVSPMVIGMTVVAFGTSAPEFVVTLKASLAEAPGLAVGNIVGSNIANILLIIGLTALCAPIPAQGKPMVVDVLFLSIASLVFAAFAFTGAIDRWTGGVLALAFCIYMGRSVWTDLSGRPDVVTETMSQEAAELAKLPGGIIAAWAAVVIGLAGLILGSDQVVDGGVGVARTFGVSEAVIGLTLVAIGTSLPELAASVVSAIRGHTDIAVGNVLGSNLFNMLLVGGTVAMIKPMPVDPQIANFDLPVMLLATAIFLPCLLGVRARRGYGLMLLAGYVGYIATQASGVPTMPW